MWLFLFLFVNPWHSVWFSIVQQAGFGGTLPLAGGEAESRCKLWEVPAHAQWLQGAARAVSQFIDVQTLSYMPGLSPFRTSVGLPFW